MAALALSACSFQPVREAEPAPQGEPPAALAFDGDAAEAADAEGASAGGSGILDDVPAGAYELATDTATVGVHSAPDTVYTRLGVLEPGSKVLTTGRRAMVDGRTWMEIGWQDSVGWVLEAFFVKFDA